MSETFSMMPDEALAEIRRIPMDTEMVAALQDPGHVAHKAATARRHELYKAAYPVDSADADRPEPVDAASPDGELD